MKIHNIFKNIEIETKVTCSDNKGCAECLIRKKNVSEDAIITTGQIFASKDMIRIDNYKIIFKGFDFRPDTRIMARDEQMGSMIRRYDLGLTPFSIESEVFLLFKINALEYLLAGLLSWNIFSGKLRLQGNEISVHFYGDGKVLKPGQKAKMEDIVFIYGNSWQEVLEHYADTLANMHKVALKDTNWQGWGSWDYYADKFSEHDILENFSFLKQNDVNFNLIQIDDGYCIWGDWLEPNKDRFMDGLQAVSLQIARDGFVPGLWLAPFLAHKNSKLFAVHPDWFLYDGEGKPLTYMFVYYILDYSIDEVCDWLYTVLRTIKYSWGIKYFKLDFLQQGVRPCRSAIDGITPLERFHRCLKSAKDALGNDVYILGSSATLGPCLGYVDGMRSGPDISPQFSDIIKAANSSIGHWFLDKKVFNCDADYLVLRSREDEDSDHCGKANKIGQLSLTEAQTWGHFVSTFGNAVIAGDKLSCLRSERFELFKQLCRQQSCEKCIPLDFCSGDKNYVPGCYLCSNADKMSLNLFNWASQPVEMHIEGFEIGEYLVDLDNGKKINPMNGIITIRICSHGSTLLTYIGSRLFRELRYKLRLLNNDHELDVDIITGLDFKYEGNPIDISLGKHAQCPIYFDRITALGMLDRTYSELVGQKHILGIPFNFKPDHHVIRLSTRDTPYKVKVDIGKKLKSLYIMHCCEIPIKGYLNSYLVKFPDTTEEIKIIVGNHIGNSEAKYSMPWNGNNARIAWHNHQTDECLYLMEWHNPFPDKKIETLEITWPQQPANVYIVGITGIIGIQLQE